MSLILEALRKSEAERRRGLPPDLHAELPPAPVRRTRTLPAWWWLLPVAVVLAIGAWMALGRRQPAPIASAPLPVARPTTGPAVPAQSLPDRTPQPTPSAATRAPAPPPPASATPPAAAVAEITPRPKPSPTPTPPPAPSASSDAAADNGRVLLVGELDTETRKTLPPLKLSMHLWNEDPAQRFVILDGQRLGEGDRVGEATIARIERDGVLLEWNGRGIRVPVR